MDIAFTLEVEAFKIYPVSLIEAIDMVTFQRPVLTSSIIE